MRRTNQIWIRFSLAHLLLQLTYVIHSQLHLSPLPHQHPMQLDQCKAGTPVALHEGPCIPPIMSGQETCSPGQTSHDFQHYAPEFCARKYCSRHFRRHRNFPSFKCIQYPALCPCFQTSLQSMKIVLPFCSTTCDRLQALSDKKTQRQNTNWNTWVKRNWRKDDGNFRFEAL